MLILFLVLDVVFLLMVLATYFCVTRRRARIILFIDHLETITRRGLPLQAGLRMLGKDLGGVFGTRLDSVARRVEDGAPLGETLDTHPHTFPPLMRKTISLGERSGNLPAHLGELRRSYRKITDAPSQSVYYYLYPVVLTLFITMVISLMQVFIVPRFQDVFSQLAVVNRMDFLWDAVLGASQIVLVLGIGLAMFVFLGRQPFHFGIAPFRFLGRAYDRIQLWIPFLSGVVRNQSLHQFSVGAGLMLRAGATVEEAVRTAAGELEQSVFRRRFERWADALKEGRTLEELCRAERGLPKDFAWFVSNGERSGSLPDALIQAGLHFDNRSRILAELASRSVLPVFVILNGLLVLGATVAAFVPLNAMLEGIVPW